MGAASLVGSRNKLAVEYLVLRRCVDKSREAADEMGPLWVMYAECPMPQSEDLESS